MTNEENETRYITDSDDDQYHVPIIACAISEQSLRHTRIVVDGQIVSCIIDTGAETDVMGTKICRQLGLSVEDSKKKLFGYGKALLQVVGSIQVKVLSTVTGREKEVVFQVVEGDAETLLSCNTSVDLNLVQFASSSVKMIKDEADIHKKYEQVFNGIGKMKGTRVKLYVDDTIKPVPQRSRRIPFKVRDKVSKELQRLEDLDIIEKAEGPTTWISPIVVVHKENNEVRLCLDSREINKAIKRERGVIPTLDDLKKDLNGAQYFSKLDLNKGYHQLELEESSRQITTFATHEGLYRFKRLCFGINSAAETFQTSVSSMLAGLDGVMNISDDIIVFAETPEIHDERLEKVLDRLKKFQVTVNKGICKFRQESIVYFGHSFSKNGMKPTRKKIEAIKEADHPTNVSEVRSFLGMAQYLAHLIPHFSDLTFNH